ncbi:Aspartic proteinase PCS1, partial [Cucurbita argyrosperma subsp. sororia]
MPLSLLLLSLLGLLFSPSNSLSLSFPLTYHSVSSQEASLSLSSKTKSHGKFPFQYSNALVVSVPIGSPPQQMDMVVDTRQPIVLDSMPRQNPEFPILPFLLLVTQLATATTPTSTRMGPWPREKPKYPSFPIAFPDRTGSDLTGLFYLGDNPNSAKFKYVNMLTFPKSRLSPNLDKSALHPQNPMKGDKNRSNNKLTSRPPFSNRTHLGRQTMIDSGSDLTYLVDEVLQQGEGLLTEVEEGVKCVGIGRSDRLVTESNIIGNVHQQNMWVEYDLSNKRVGFGVAKCSGLKA